MQSHWPVTERHANGDSKLGVLASRLASTTASGSAKRGSALGRRTIRRSSTPSLTRTAARSWWSWARTHPPSPLALPCERDSIEAPTWPSSSPPRPQPRDSSCHQLARQEFVRTTGRCRPIETDTTSKPPTVPTARTSRSLESVGVQAPQAKNRYECSNSRRRPSTHASSVRMKHHAVTDPCLETTHVLRSHP